MRFMSELYAVCRTADIGEGQVVGFVLAKAQATGGPRPWPILVTRKGNHFYGFENACPHQGVPLDRAPGEFLDPEGNFLQCGQHRARFDPDTGYCFIGPCQGQRLTSVKVVVDDGDVCVTGVTLAEEDGLDLADPDAMPEVMIQPD